MTIQSSVPNLNILTPKKESLAKMIFVLLLLVNAPRSVIGQYSFTISTQYIGGNCEDMRRTFNDWLAEYHVMKTNYATKSECESARARITNSAKQVERIYQVLWSQFGVNASCNFKLFSSPCTSRSGIRTADDIDIFTSGHGEAMFFQNPAVEVSNWAKENEKLMSIIGGITDSANFNPNITGDNDFDRTLLMNLDKPFMSVNMRDGGFSTTSSSDLSMRNKVFEAPDYSLEANMNNVKRYLSLSSDLALRYIKNPDPSLLTAWFHEEFKRVSGYDVDAIMRKLPSERTKEEKQALIDYQMYRRGLADKMLEDLKPYIAVQEETRAYEKAVLSAASYGGPNVKYLETTNYVRKSSSDFGIDDPMRAFAELIEKYNETNSISGFYAELYYNNVTGEYTVAFEGSNSLSDESTSFSDVFADWEGNIVGNGLIGIHPQYVLAYYLGQFVANELPDGIKVDFTGHSLGGGDATVAAMASGAPAYVYNPEFVSDFAQIIGGLKANGNIHTWKTDDDPLSILQDNAPPIGNLRPAMGDVRIIKTNEGHSIVPMVETLNEGRGTFTAWQNSVHNAGYGHEQQTQETIMIYTGE